MPCTTNNVAHYYTTQVLEPHHVCFVKHKILYFCPSMRSSACRPVCLRYSKCTSADSHVCL
jgi:hypothetical protein